MNYGLYLAASGMMVNEFRQDVAGNNIANMNTPGFKPDFVMVKGRAPERIEDQLEGFPSKDLLEGLGGGVLADQIRTSQKQGRLVHTGNSLDLAIKGEGFFTLMTGQSGSSLFRRFTRDGRFTLDNEGYLVHATSGMRVLSDGNSSIRLQEGIEPIVDADGVITQNGEQVGRLQVVTTPDQSAFKKAGNNTFTLDNNAQKELTDATGQIRQRWYEGSSVDPMRALLALKSASGAVADAVRMMQYHDGLMKSAINRLGRVG